MPPIRRGGRAHLSGELTLTWSQAEGTRGTRWREVLSAPDEVRQVVLIETSTGDRLRRLELASSAGLLTLHPEPDETALHGNVVTPDGVRHLAFAWSPDHELMLVASPSAATITLARLGGLVEIGGTTELDVIRIDHRLEPRPGRWVITHRDARSWHLRDVESGEERQVTFDSSSWPVLPDATNWPLEA